MSKNLLEPVIYTMRRGHIDDVPRGEVFAQVIGHIEYPPWKELVGIPYSVTFLRKEK